MAEEAAAARQTTINPPEENSGTEMIRKILAAIIGIIMIILIVLAAKWVGDQVRQRFLTNKPPTVQTIPPEETANSTPGAPPTKIATYSAIPNTGPSDFLYPVIGLVLVSGLLYLKVAASIVKN